MPFDPVSYKDQNSIKSTVGRVSTRKVRNRKKNSICLDKYNGLRTFYVITS